MRTRLLLITLCVGVWSTVSGCTLDFVRVGAGVGVGTSTPPDRFYWDDPPYWGDPWDPDWLYGRGGWPWGYRRYGPEP